MDEGGICRTTSCVWMVVCRSKVCWPGLSHDRSRRKPHKMSLVEVTGRVLRCGPPLERRMEDVRGWASKGS